MTFSISTRVPGVCPTPKVSVIIPCYNLGRYLDEAVSSVLAQTFTDLEIVVVNDGSTDRFTCELLADYRRPKTRVIHTENGGVSAARNRAIQESAGDYILPLDADDLIAPRYLEQAVPVLDADPAVGIVSCRIEFFGAVNYRPELPAFSAPSMVVRNDLPCASLFRKSDWCRVGGYSREMQAGWEDWDFWLSLLEQGVQVRQLSEVLFRYRIRQGSRERTLSAEHHIQLYQQLYRNHQHFYHEHMAELFKELVECRERLASPAHRLANRVEAALVLRASLGRWLRGKGGATSAGRTSGEVSER